MPIQIFHSNSDHHPHIRTTTLTPFAQAGSTVSLLLKTMTKCTRGAVVMLGSAPVPSMKLPVIMMIVVLLILLEDSCVACADLCNSLRWSSRMKRLN